MEEHSIIGGPGSTVAEEVLSEKVSVSLKRIGVNDMYGESGSAKKLIEKYDLDGYGIYDTVKNFLGKLE